MIKILIFFILFCFNQAFADQEGKAYCIQGALESGVERSISGAAFSCNGQVSVAQGRCIYAVLVNRIEDNVMLASFDCNNINSVPVAICIAGALNSRAENSVFSARFQCENAVR